MSDHEPTPGERNRTRLFLIVFFGLALLLSITTILGTWNTERENAELPAPVSTP